MGDERQQVAAALDGLSAEALKRIAKTLGIPVGKDRASALKVVGEFLGTEGHREALERLFEPDDWDLLSRLLWRMEAVKLYDVRSVVKARAASRPPDQTAPVPIRPVQQVASLRQPDAAWEPVARLLAHGCLVPYQGDRLRGPKLGIELSDLEYTSGSFFFERIPSVGTWAAAHAAGRIRLERVSFAGEFVPAAFNELQRALFIITAELRSKPMRIKQSGALYEADITRVASAVAGSGGRGAKRTVEEPAIFWFALGALVTAGLIKSEGGNFVTTTRAASFLAKPQESQASHLATASQLSSYDDMSRIQTLFIQARARADRPWFSADSYTNSSQRALFTARSFLRIAIAEAVRGDPSGWYRIEDLTRLMIEEHPDFLFPAEGSSAYYGWGQPRDERPSYPGISRREPKGGETTLYRDTDWPEVEGAFVRQVLVEAYRWLGLVEFGPTFEAAEYFRLTDIGRHVLCGISVEKAGAERPVAALTVQPNFDVVVPHAMADVGLLAQLDTFAERRTVDVAATYHLSQPAFVAALDGDWTLSRVVELLEGASKVPLPQNVRFSLNEWAAVHERLTLRTGATVLEADDEGQLERWLRDGELRTVLGERLGPCHVLLPARHVDAARRRLAALGVQLPLVDQAQPIGKVVRLKPPDLIRVSGGVKPTPYLLYRLRAAADPDGPPGDLVFRLTEETVRRANARGWSGRDLLEFLSSVTRDTAVPLEMRTRILGWSGTLGAARFAPVVAVQVPDSSLSWKQLQQLPGVGELLRAIPSPALALVAAGDLEALRQALAPHAIRLAEGTLDVTQPAEETAEEELKRVLRAHRDEPWEVVEALRGVRMLGKIDREREGYS